MFKARAHEVRDLLKSMLLIAKCAPWAADHVIGHPPRDSYEKQQLLYPDDLRAEYAKASERINMFSRISNHLKNSDTQESVQHRMSDLERTIETATEEIAQLTESDKQNKKMMKLMEENNKQLAGIIKDFMAGKKGEKKKNKKEKDKKKNGHKDVCKEDGGKKQPADDEKTLDGCNPSPSDP